MPSTRLALGILLLSAFAEIAAAQQPPATRIALDIASQPIESALNELARQSGIQVAVYSKAGIGIVTPRISARLTAQEALSRLLANTPLHAKWLDDHTVAVYSSQPELDSAPYKKTSSVESNDRPLDEATPSFSSDTPTASESPGPYSTERPRIPIEEVVVTGTHIRSDPGALPASPLIEITRDDIDRSGFSSTADLVASLPQNYSGGTFQGQRGGAADYSSEFNTSAGGVTPSLRGLGAATLVLVDGHRLSGSAGTNGSDIAGIPLAAVQRVEIIPDGASAIYGADAGAGVINFIIRHDYQGIALGASAAEPTRKGGGLQQNYSVLGGTQWDTGNGLLSCNYLGHNALLFRDRTFSQDVIPGTQTFDPQTSTTSCTTYLRQDLTDSLSLTADGIYSSRSSHVVNNLEPSLLRADGHTKEFIADVSLLYRAGSWDWRMETNAAEDSEIFHSVQLGDLTGPPLDYGLTRNLDRTYSLELSGNGTVAKLPAGEVRGAIGAGYRRQKYDEYYIPETQPPISATSRNIYYVYGELQMPLISADPSRTGLEALELSMSARTDHYNDFGSTTNPKIGLVYTPADGVHIRGTYGTSYRAPTLSNLYGPTFGYLFLSPDTSPQGYSIALTETGGRSTLKPEKSDAWTITVDFTPEALAGLRLSTTYFSYNFRDKISLPVTVNQFAIPLSDPRLSPFTTFNPTLPTVQSIVDNLSQPLLDLTGLNATPADVRAILDDRSTNISRWASTGEDVSVKYETSSPVGLWAFDFNGTHLNVRQKATPISPYTTLSGVLFDPPRFRFRSTAALTRGALSISTAVNFTSSERFSLAGPEFEVGSFTTFDLQFGYQVADSSISFLNGTRISVGALNVFDRNPPLLPQSAGYYTLASGGFDGANASPYGRIITASIVKQFAP